MISIRAVSYLKKVVGFSEKKFDPDKPTPVRELVDLTSLPDERIIVIINDKGGQLDTEVHKDDTVVLLPVVGGG
ncbi:MAG: MoaD/ThiS family protein [Candidatus Kariarchaeaceae archaeon]|jgi:molybdopterin converting factor small subunit